MNITEEKLKAARLYFVDGLTAKEVSERLDMSQAYVKTIVQNVRIRGIIHREYKGKVKR